MSGSPIFAFLSPDNLYHLAEKQARLLNCPTDNSKVIVNCLKTKTWRELGDSLDGFSVSFSLCFDKILIFIVIFIARPRAY